MTLQRIFWVRMLLGLLLFIGAACATMVWYGTQRTLPPGLTVDHWEVGGITIAEFERQLEDKKKLLLQQTVRMESRRPDVQVQPADWMLEQLGLELPLQEVSDRLQPLKNGSIFQRAVYRWRIRNAEWPLAASFDASKLHAALMRGFPELYNKQPEDAQRIIGPNDMISYVPETAVMRINEPELLNQLQHILPSMGAIGWTAAADSRQLANYPFGEGSSQSAVHGMKPEDAAPAVTPVAKSPFLIALPFIRQEPALNISMLQAQGIDRKISEFTTTYPQNGEGRIHNIRSTAQSIQDVLLKPGETFDYAAYIAQTEAKFGFKEAPVILNGKLVPGIGGGICQVSSTLYNAVLRAGLQIVERRNHSLPVSYVPLGQDATFASGHINFKFRNNTEKYILIRTYTDDRRITVKLFGQTPADVTYAVESTTIEKLQPSIKYVLNPTLPNGRKQTISKGKTGYVVDTYRIKLQNGIEVSRERVSRDTYAAQPTIIATNDGGAIEPNTRRPEAPLIEDGVKGPTFR
ncbi:VanW family protein [Paenibacillus doosanensis]|uniref:VanW family protein n=1 Tax=Paenibacillus doosanensis TaxID=1229154 RepID=UPI00217FBB35|nr:VanW family protein [Paenibacillus doosanensis]MCS7459929.1 VanW family protein [Paenibacillus doosanensis]